MVIFNKSKTFGINKSKRFIGCEIEVAYSNPEKRNYLVNTSFKWHGNIGTDGSINGHNPPSNFKNGKIKFRPNEIRTAPTNGDLFIKQMMEYGYALNSSDTFANKTCGFHVHVDARDLKPVDLDKVLVLWSKVESPMFNLVKPGRANSDWCNRWKFSGDIKRIEQRITHNEDYIEGCGHCDRCDYGFEEECLNPPKRKKRLLNEIKKGYIDINRYSSLNLCSLEDLGTLENRMHHGTTNPDSMINWGLINASLIDFAKAKSMTYIQKMPKGFETLLATINNDNVRRWAIDKKDAWKSRPITTLYQDQVDDRKW